MAITRYAGDRFVGLNEEKDSLLTKVMDGAIYITTDFDKQFIKKDGSWIRMGGICASGEVQNGMTTYDTGSECLLVESGIRFFGRTSDTGVADEGNYLIVSGNTSLGVYPEVDASGEPVDPQSVLRVIGDLRVEGDYGTLVEADSNITSSLFSVSDSAGLPVFEVFPDDRVVAGRYDQSDFIIDSSGNVGIGVTGEILSKFHFDSASGKNDELLISAFEGQNAIVNISGTKVTAGPTGPIKTPIKWTISGDYANSGHLKIRTESGVFVTLTNESGYLGLGTEEPEHTLHVSGDAQISGYLYDIYNSTGQSGWVLTSESGGPVWRESSAGTIDGSGISGYLSVWEDQDTLGNSPVYQYGSNIGVDTTTIGAKLQVGGNNAVDTAIMIDAAAGSNGNRRWKFNAKAGSNHLEIGSNTNTQIFVLEGANGSVGIGMIPQHALHVNGDAMISGYLYDSLNTTGQDGWVLTSKSGGSQWQMIEDVLSGVGGSGTANYVPLWQDEDTIGNSIIYEDSGNIGIGTNDPQSKLQISKTSYGDLTLHRDANEGAGVELGEINFALNSSISSNQETWSKISAHTNSSNYRTDLRLYVKSTGGSLMQGLVVHGTASDGPYVGIGTAIPDRTLHILPNSDAPAIKVGHDGTQGHASLIEFDNGYTQKFYVGMSDTYASRDFVIAEVSLGSSTDATNPKYVFNGNGDGAFYITDAADNDIKVFLNTNGDSYLNGGNLGINVESPLHKFHVSGDAQISGYLYDYTNSTGQNGYVLTSRSGGPVWEEAGGGTISGSGVSGYVARWDGETNLTSGVIYDDGTSVGIGTTTLAEALTVNGRVEAEEFIGDLRGAVVFKASAGENISKGQAVYISGISGNKTVVSLADADDASKMPAFGVAAETASANSDITIYTFGTLSNIDTSSWTEGTELFVGTTAGELVSTAPAGESAQIQKIAKVTRQDATVGSVKIMGAGRSNATPNLNEGRLFVGNSSNRAVADGTVYVDIANSKVGINTTSPQHNLHVSGDAIISGYLYDSTNSTGAAGYVLTSENNGPQWKLIEDVLSGVGGSGTANYVPLWQDEDTLTDSVIAQSGNSIGIGTNTPQYKIDLYDATDSASKIGFHNATTGPNAGDGTRVGLNGAEFFINNQENGAIKIYTQSTQTNGITIDGVGKVGVGTTTPSQKLHVAGAIKSTTFFTSETAANAAYFDQDGTNARITSKGADDQTLGGFKVLQQASDGVPNNTPIEVQIDGDVLLAQSSGSVGIAENTPLARLHVGGDGKFDLADGEAVHLDGAGNTYFKIDKANATDEAIISFETAGSNNFNLGTAADTTKLYVSGNGFDLFTIQNQGNVGINTKYPEVGELATNNSNPVLTLNGGLPVINLNNSGINFSTNPTEVSTLRYTVYDASVVGPSDVHGIEVASISAEYVGDGTEYNSDLVFSVASGDQITSSVERARLTYSGQLKLNEYGNGSNLVGNANSHLAVDNDGNVIQVSSNGTTNFLPRYLDNYGALDDSVVQQNGNKIGINVVPEHQLHVSGDAIISGYLYDSTNSTGSAGYILSSEAGGPQWKQIEDVLSGVGGSGTADYVARWQDEDTLTTGILYDNGSSVGVGTNSPSSIFTVSQSSLPVISTIEAGSNLDTFTNTDAGILRFRGPYTNSYTPIGDIKVRTNASAFRTDIVLMPRSTGGSLVEGLVVHGTVSDGAFVGIGTGTPSSKLHVVNPDTDATPTALLQNGSTGDASLHFNVSGRSYTIGIDNSDDDKFKIARNNGLGTTDRLTINGDGNVGIGTTSPTSTLNISDSTAGASVLKVDGSSGTIFEVTDDLSNSLMSVNTIAGLPVFEVFADYHIVAGRYNQNDFYLSTGGSLGLGTATPSYKLDVFGGGRIYQNTSAVGAGMGLTVENGGTGDAVVQYLISGVQRWVTGIDNSDSDKFKIAKDTDVGVNTYLTIQTDGKVGIGTVSPGNTLHIYNNATIGAIGSITTANAGLRIQDSSTNMYIDGNSIIMDATGYITTTGSQDLGFGTNSTYRLWLDRNGEVGIGTTNPAAKLHINRDDTTRTDLILENNRDVATSEIGAVQYKALNDAAESQLYSQIVGVIDNPVSGSEQGRIAFETAISGVVATRMTIDGANVGIGNGNPDKLFVVQGGNAEVVINDTDGSPSPLLRFRENGTTSATIRTDTDLIFSVATDEEMRLTDDGKLGIGVDPAYELHVNGDAIISGYLYDSTNSTGVAGYVLTSEAGGPQWQSIEDVLSGVGGSGTANYVPLWQDEDTLTDSIIQQDGGCVGIGISPDAKLHVLNKIKIEGGSSILELKDNTDNDDHAIIFSDNNDNTVHQIRSQDHTTASPLGDMFFFEAVGNLPIGFVTNDEHRLTILGGGSVGIGTTSPTSTLNIYDGTSGASVLKVDGTNGTLFEVVDNLSGSLMSVNDAAGLPVLEVFADSHIVAGRYGQNDFYLDTNGNLGLGTSSPDAKLEIVSSGGTTASTIAGTGLLVVNNSQASNNSRIGIIGGTTGFSILDMGDSGDQNIGGIAYDNNANKLYLRANDNYYLTILSDGKVGIGTTTPSTKLHVLGGGATISGGETTLNPSGTGATIASKILSLLNTYDTAYTSDALDAYNATTSFDISDKSSYTFFARPKNTNIFTHANETSGSANLERYVNLNSSSTEPLLAWEFYQYDGSGATSSDFQTPDKLFRINVREGSANNTKFIITGDGNVGIGNETPSSRLQVRAAISTVYANVAPDIANTIININNTQTSETTNDQAQIQFNVNGGTYNRIGSIGLIAEDATNRKAALVFTTDDASTRAEKMRITGDGNVGIGTDNPTYKLTVASPNTIAPFALRNSSNSNRRYLAVTSQSNNPNLALFDSSETSTIELNTNGDSFLNGGNVGIGVSPSTRLHVLYPAVGQSGAAVTSITTTQALNLGVKLSFTGGDNSNGNIIGGIALGNGGEEYAGIYAIDGGSSAATDLAFFVGDTNGINEAIRIDSSGSVGIGTSDPDLQLHVKSSSGNSNLLLQRESFTSWQISAGSTYLTFLQYGGSELLRIQNTGKVGIGTTSPNVKLEIHGSDITTSADTTAESVLRLVRDIVDPNATLRKDSAVDFMLSRQQAIANNLPYTRLDIRLAGITDSSTPSVDVMSLLYDGNVGIGTTSPSYPLDVVGYVNSSIGFRAGNYTILNESGNETSFGNSAYYGVSFKTNNAVRMKIANAGNIQFNTYGSGSNTGTSTYYLTVDSSGNVIEELISSGTPTGSGTTNYIPKWNGAVSLTDSVIYEAGGNIGINQTTPANYKLYVSGTGTDYNNAVIRTDSASNQAYTYSLAGIASGGLSTGNRLINMLGTAFSPYNAAYWGFKNTGGTSSASNEITFGLFGYNDLIRISATNLQSLVNVNPAADATYSIGTSSLRWYETFSTRFSAADGSQTVPTFRFINDTDTGLFRSGTDTLNFTTAGSEKARIQSDGNVGIGTTSPSQALEVAGQYIKVTGNNAGLMLNDTSSGSNFVVFSNGDNLRMVVDGGSFPSAYFQMSTAGHVGLGANADSTDRLTVAGNIHATSTVAGASVLTIDGTSGTIFEVTDDLSSSLMSVNTIAGLPVFEVFADYHIVAGRYNQNDFYLSAGGSLGLGTATPTERLHVIGNGLFSGQLRVYGSTSVSGSVYGAFLGSYSGGTSISPGELVLATQGKTGWGPGDELGRIRFYLGDPSGNGERDVAKIVAVNEDGNGSSTTTASGALAFYTSAYNNVNLLERVRIDQSGKVGINTDNPTARLQINDDYTIDATYGGDDIYIKGTTNRSSYDPVVYNTSDIEALITVSSNTTTGPDQVGLVLYNDDNTAGGFSPMLLFSKRETGSSPYKAAMAGIYARSPLGTGDNNAWIDGELIFATAGASSEGIKQRVVINKEGLVGIGTLTPSDYHENADNLVLANEGLGGDAGLSIRSGTSGGGSIYFADGTSGDQRYRGIITYSHNTDQLVFSTAASNRLTILNDGQIKFNNYGGSGFTGTATQRLAVDSSGNVIQIPIGAGAVDGAGTANYIPIWTDSDTIGNSVIYQDNGNVGVGMTSTPSYKLQVNGSFAATTKSFVIDHPTKPNKKLRYASLEGPENGVYVRGKGDSNVIELPEYWTELVHEESITVNLTAIGRDSNKKIRAYSVDNIEDNKVYIYTDSSDNIYNYFFTVYGERKDVERLEVEVD